MKKLYSLFFTLLFVACSVDNSKKIKVFPDAEKIINTIALTDFPDYCIIVSVPIDSLNSLSVLQNAIDSCSLHGGGTVIVERGVYFLDGPLILKSDVNLHLKEGSYLKFSGDSSDFLPVVHTRWEGTELYGYSPMIYAYHANNIAITGKGIIDAQGGIEFAKWAAIESDDRGRLREMGDKLVPVNERIFGEGTVLRPSCIQPFGCSRILIEGVMIKNSPFWTIHPVYCDNVIVRNVTIDSHYPNNDGCDPESTYNVLIEDCTFRTGDDAIAIKSGRDTDGRNIGRASRNIVVRNCKFYSECNGLCIGSEMSGGVSDVYMSNIEIGIVNNALYFKSNKDRGGYIRNVYIDNVRIERVRGAILRFENNYFGYRGGNYEALYENFFISNVKTGTSNNYAFFMDGNETRKIDNIRIENFHVDNAKYLYYFKNVNNVRFINSTVNGYKVPICPVESLERIAFDIY
jgi:hypothetical protein